MFVSSRMDGNIYRITPFKEAWLLRETWSVDRHRLRSFGHNVCRRPHGPIYKVNGIGEEACGRNSTFRSAYHLALAPTRRSMYRTYVASFDSVMRVDDHGDASVFYRASGVRKGSRLTATETFVLLLRCVAGGDRAHSLPMEKTRRCFVAE